MGVLKNLLIQKEEKLKALGYTEEHTVKILRMWTHYE